MGQYLCCLDQNIDPAQPSKQDVRLIRVSKNYPKVTQITIEQIALDLLGESSNYNNLYQPNQQLSFQQDKLILKINFGDDEETSFKSEVFQPDSIGNATSLFSAFDETRPISKIMIDYFTLAICPQHCEIELKSIKNEKIFGRVQFDIEFQQLEEIQIVMKDLRCRFDGKNEKPLYAVFKALTNQESVVSKETETLFGEYNKEKNKTIYHWGIAMNLYEDPTVNINASMNTIKQSTLHICLYQNKEFQRIDQLKRKRSRQSKDLDDSFDELEQNEPRTQRNSKRSSQFSTFSTYKEQPTNKSPLKLKGRRFSKLNNGEFTADLKKHKTITRIIKKPSLDGITEYNSNLKQDSADFQSDDDELFTDLNGECYICFSKLLKTELRLFDRRDSFVIKNSMSMTKRQSTMDLSAANDSISGLKLGVSQRGFGTQDTNMSLARQQSSKQIKKFSEKISVGGKYNGKIKGSYKISNIPVLQQMSIGILTENGIFMTSAPILTDNETSLFFFKKSKSNQKIKDLQNLIKKLKELDQLKGRKQTKSSQEKEQLLREIINLLQQSDQFQRKMFYYECCLDLIGAQQTLIELGFHCLMFASNVKYELRHYYYTMLTLIFEREELKLSSVGFLADEESEGLFGLNQKALQSQGVNKEQIKEERLKIAKYYQKLLFNTLDDAVTKFCRKGVELYLRNYIEKFISTALFRIPNFRKVFIETILKKSNNSIEEWKNISWNIDNNQDEDQDASLQQFFDWENHFYLQIPDCKEKKDAQQILLRMMYNEKWQSKIQKRTQAFFEIICKVVDQMHHTVSAHNQSKQNMFWQDIPGYNQILKAFLQELKNLQILDYPDSLIEASNTFLTNTQLLSIFITIIFKKTNVYDSIMMTKSYDLVTKWIIMIDKKGEPFPSNFDFSFFFQAIQISLDKIDHNLSTSKVLWSLYKILHILPLEQRLILSHEFIRKYFYRFFFHWSYNIREVFYMLLLYEIDFNLLQVQAKKMTQIEDSRKSMSSSRLGEMSNFDKRQFRKQQTINLEKYLEDLNMEKSQSKDSNNTRGGQSNDDDEFFTLLETVQSQRASTNKRSFIKKESERKQILTKLMNVQKLIDQKFDDIEYLSQYVKMKGNYQLPSKKANEIDEEEEYVPTSDSDSDKEKDEEQLKQIKIENINHKLDEINLNKIMNRIPEELHIYVQDKVFNQYDQMFHEFEEWQSRITSGENSRQVVILPEINVDNLVPLDDVFHENKIKEY